MSFAPQTTNYRYALQKAGEKAKGLGAASAQKRLQWLVTQIDRNSSEANNALASGDLYNLVDVNGIVEGIKVKHVTHPWLNVLEGVRNVLVLVPLFLTWFEISKAVSAYQSFLNAHPTEYNQPILYLWETGFQGKLALTGFGALTLGGLASADAVLLLVIAILTAVIATRTHFYNNRRDEQAEELRSDLADALAYTTLALTTGTTAPGSGGVAPDMTAAANAMERASENMKVTSEALQATSTGLVAANQALGRTNQALLNTSTGLNNSVTTLGNTVAALNTTQQQLVTAVNAAATNLGAVATNLGTMIARQDTMLQKQQTLVEKQEAAVAALQTLKSLGNLVGEVTNLNVKQQKLVDDLTALWQEQRTMITSVTSTMGNMLNDMKVIDQNMVKLPDMIRDIWTKAGQSVDRMGNIPNMVQTQLDSILAAHRSAAGELRNASQELHAVAGKLRP